MLSVPRKACVRRTIETFLVSIFNVLALFVTSYWYVPVVLANID